MFKNFFHKYFVNAYGWDMFSSFLTGCGIIVMFIARWSIPLGMGIIIYAIARSLSKYKDKRIRENAAFKKFISFSQFNGNSLKGKTSSLMNYKVLTCPNCSQKLRVPRHKGKITVTCKSCKHEFKAKS